jgi:uncharacterized protein YndB with AHSA1/START domain/DNA-binding transcriptional ArsR family regulator
MTQLDVQRALAALSEPTRFRIVSLLADRACTVSEVQEAIGARQPQTTKHIQALEAAGVIRVHRLGRRRVARLHRDTMEQLGAYFSTLSASAPDDAALDGYEQAIHREHRGEGPRSLTFERTLPASANRVWAAWTDPAIAARWWAPRHFDVDELALDPTPGAPVRLVLREGSARYASEGRMLEAEAPRRLVFTLAPVDDDGAPLFHARHTVVLDGAGDRTRLTLSLEVAEVGEGAASAVAGLEPGWSQLLDALESELAGRS